MLRTLCILLLLALPAASHAGGDTTPAELIDTTIVVDKIQVSAIKQGMVLRSQPVAAAILGSRAIERERIVSLHDLSQRVPNFHAPEYGSRMTSSIYVRGLGARIDQPVVGMNVDNVPVLNKDNFDTELADAERIEVLRGPQSTLYGRNTMGGVVNIYTLSPLMWQGVRVGMEYGSGNSMRLRAGYYDKFSEGLAMSFTGYYNRSDGFFNNLHTGAKCDWERIGGGRWKTQWRAKNGLRIDNTFSFSVLDQGGYPYAYIGKEIVSQGQTVIRPGEIRYNDPSSYRRTTISNGLTVRYDFARFSLSSITAYQYSDDAMTLDQDFTPLPYFTLTQAHREHSITEDIVFRSRDERAYRWLFGAFGFYRHGVMDAPVNFKQTGIDSLIFAKANNDPNVVYSKTSDALFLGSDFRMPVYGGALYHESNYTYRRWRFTAGLRVDMERTQLHYHSTTDMDYFVAVNGREPVRANIRIDQGNSLSHTYIEVLPKFSVMFSFDENRNLYLSAAKGYKAGGFNTQMFSDILQEKIKWKMASGLDYNEPDVMSYRPEYSWNYEFGGHFSCIGGAVRGDFALFYIDCRDQQLTVFPAGSSTGRMMTNAGRTRSFGGEVSFMALPWRQVELNLAYGYTNARFVSYHNGQQDFAGNNIPYAPRHTLSGAVSWTIPTGVAWLGEVVLRADAQCAGRIYWNEENTLSQPFYALVGASVRFEHKHYSIDIWGRNLAGEAYDVFYFKSIGNEFVQRGRPRTFGITLNININK